MINIQENVPLASLNSFRVGGNALFYIEIKSVEDLREALGFAKEKKLDFYVLGGGTNVLISDKGYQGVVIRMKMNEVSIGDTVMEIQAGVPLIKAVNTAAASGLAGIEKMAGIPGTVGGAVRGNAGAFGVEMKEHVTEVVAFDCQTSEIITFDTGACKFEYRSSIFKQKKNLIVLSVKIALEKGNPEEIKQAVASTIEKRTSTGLHGVKSAGSYFMNPLVTNTGLLEEFIKEKGVEPRGSKLPAGWVIQQAGLGGKKIGGAAVSEMHANYIINAEDATSDEVVMLVSYVKQQVRDKFGVQLQEEVNYVGF